jgi:hypothetical protein
MSWTRVVIDLDNEDKGAIREEGLNVRAMMHVCVSPRRSANVGVGGEPTRLCLEAGTWIRTETQQTSSLKVRAGSEAGAP